MKFAKAQWYYILWTAAVVLLHVVLSGHVWGAFRKMQ